MVVISVALLTKQGKILLARQFVEISRLQLEDFLGNFVKLVDKSLQHTFVENESVRYVFQPLDDVYLVLLTTKTSNIVEDLETLRLAQKVVQLYCTFGVDEATIFKNSFELIWAFDDVISMGYRESVSLSQVQEYAGMESTEERIHKEKLKVQMQEAKELAKRRMKEIDKQRATEVRSNTGFGPTPEDSAPPPQPRSVISEPARVESELPTTVAAEVPAPAVRGAKAPTKGMSLTSKGKRATDFS